MQQIFFNNTTTKYCGKKSTTETINSLISNSKSMFYFEYLNAVSLHGSKEFYCILPPIQDSAPHRALHCCTGKVCGKII